MSNNHPKQLSLFDQNSENPDSYFTKKRSWSASKHRLMLKYIQSFCYTLGGTKSYQSQYLNYVDGFAGAGKYDQGIGIKDFVDNSNFWKNHTNDFADTDGSPLIALKCANIFQEENRVNLRCFFTEANKQNNQKLQNNCRDIGNKLDYKIYDPQEFRLVLPKIIDDLEQYPTLFFLDAFAVKGVTFREIAEITNYLSKYKGEFFLLFHNSSVARNAGQSTAKSNLKAAETYSKHLTQLLGDNSDQDWKTMWLQLRNSPQAFERWAIEYFKARILCETAIKGVTSFEIKESYNDSRPQYSIVVGSNYPDKAFGYFLNDFVWEENKLLFYKENDQHIQKFLDTEWNKEIKNRKKLVKEKSISILEDKNKDWRPVQDVITDLILGMDNLGYLKRKEYREMILELYKQGKLQAEKLGKQERITLQSEIKIVQ